MPREPIVPPVGVTTILKKQGQREGVPTDDVASSLTKRGESFRTTEACLTHLELVKNYSLKRCDISLGATLNALHNKRRFTKGEKERSKLDIYSDLRYTQIPQQTTWKSIGSFSRGQFGVSQRPLA